MAKRLISTVLTVVMAAVLLTGCVKVVKIGHEGDLTGQKEFNPGDSVEAIWDSEVIPECRTPLQSASAPVLLKKQ